VGVFLGVPTGMLGLAFAVAAFVTGAELLSSQYARTVPFALRSIWFYIYVFIYGALGAILLALLPWVSDQFTVQGVGANNPWVRAFLVGFTVKALLHIRIYSVTTGPGQSFPVGLESLVQLFEPWLLRELQLDHYAKQTAFIAPRAQGFAGKIEAITAAKSNPPPGLSPAERIVFDADIDQAANPAQVIAVYLKYSGIRLTSITFP
jgi:hypothetical protein